MMYFVLIKLYLYEVRRIGKKHYSSNDQRSNSMNPNNSAYWTSIENRANQINPNNDEYKGHEEKKNKKD